MTWFQMSSNKSQKSPKGQIKWLNFLYQKPPVLIILLSGQNGKQGLIALALPRKFIRERNRANNYMWGIAIKFFAQAEKPHVGNYEN